MPAKNAQPFITMRNTKQAQTEGRYEINGLYSSKVLSQERQGNADDELLWIKEDYTDENSMQPVILCWIRDQKEVIFLSL